MNITKPTIFLLFLSSITFAQFSVISGDVEVLDNDFRNTSLSQNVPEFYIYSCADGSQNPCHPESLFVIASDTTGDGSPPGERARMYFPWEYGGMNANKFKVTASWPELSPTAVFASAYAYFDVIGNQAGPGSVQASIWYGDNCQDSDGNIGSPSCIELVGRFCYVVEDTLDWDAGSDSSVSTDTCNGCWVSLPAWRNYSDGLYSDQALNPESCQYYDHCHHDTPDSILCGVGYYDGIAPVLLDSFNLVSPPNDSLIVVTASNGSTDSIAFLWESSASASVGALYNLSAEHILFSGSSVLDTAVHDTTVSDTTFVFAFTNLYDDLWVASGDSGVVSWDVSAIEGQDTIPSSNGPFKILVKGSSLSTDPESIPEKFRLYSAYPNPFNPLTTIRFGIPVATLNTTSLQIYDITGRRVETLINTFFNPGEYEISWDASHHASGVYFAVLQNGQNRQTQKLVFLK